MIEIMEDARNDKKEGLQECFRLLKPGGELALSVQTSSTLSKAIPAASATSRSAATFPWSSGLRKHSEDASATRGSTSRRRLLMMGRNAGFETRKSEYAFPPLDTLRLLFREPHRRLGQQLRKSPLVRFGVSLYGVFQKPRGAPKSSQLDAESRFKVLGVEVDAVEIKGAVARMESWIQERNTCHSIAATSMHGIVEAQRHQRFKEILNSTDLVVPDGMPLVWLGRRQGYRLPRRVYGPDLMLTFFETTAARGYRHFFYGGEPGVAERLAKSLQERFSGSQVAGTFSPPFRPLTEAEDNDVVSLISRAAPDVLWVGLGTPRQEHWMHLHRSRLLVPVQVSVGAAFDILSGRRRQAPCWMRERGLEWLFRFLQEPRRLWRRYLVYGGLFVVLLVADACTSTLASGRTIFSQI